MRAVSRALLLCLLAAGCDRAVPEASPSPTPAEEETALPAVTSGAIVHGRITLHGDPPPPQAHLTSLDPAVCGAGPKTDRSLLVDPATHGLAWAVVTLGSAGTPALPGSATVDQARCEYYPFVTLVRPGARVTVTNSDEALHDVHRIAGNGASFHQAAPPGVASSFRIDAPDRVHLLCDLHFWTSAWVIAPAAPFAAVTAEDGGYTLRGVPAGTFTLRVWTERFGEASRPVTVPDGGTVTADLEIAPTPVLARGALGPPTPSPTPAASPHPAHGEEPAPGRLARALAAALAPAVTRARALTGAEPVAERGDESGAHPGAEPVSGAFPGEEPLAREEPTTRPLAAPLARAQRAVRAEPRAGAVALIARRAR